MSAIGACEGVSSARISGIQLGTGLAAADLDLPRGLFYETLSNQSGFTIQDDGDLMELLTELAGVKSEYDKVAAALQEVKRDRLWYRGPPPPMSSIWRSPRSSVRGGRYGVRLKASAPSIHMIRADIETEVSPSSGMRNNPKR